MRSLNSNLLHCNFNTLAPSFSSISGFVGPFGFRLFRSHANCTAQGSGRSLLQDNGCSAAATPAEAAAGDGRFFL